MIASGNHTKAHVEPRDDMKKPPGVPGGLSYSIWAWLLMWSSQ